MMNTNWISLARILDFCHQRDNNLEQEIEGQAMWQTSSMFDQLIPRIVWCSSMHRHALHWHQESFSQTEGGQRVLSVPGEKAVEKSAFLGKERFLSGWTTAFAFSKCCLNSHQYVLTLIILCLYLSRQVFRSRWTSDSQVCKPVVLSWPEQFSSLCPSRCLLVLGLSSTAGTSTGTL